MNKVITGNMTSASAYAPKVQTYARNRQRSFVGGNFNLSVASVAAEEVISPRRRYGRETAIPVPQRKTKTVEQVIPKTKTRTETRKREKVASKKLLKKQAAAIVLVLFFFSMYAVLISRFSLLSQKTLDTASLKSQITVAQNEVNTLESTLAAKNNINSIKEKAATQSQMGFAKNNQVVYVDVPAVEDETNISKDSNENSGFSSILQFLGLS